MTRRAIVIVMVEPPDNRGRLSEWQWPQAKAQVIARSEEEKIIPDAIANEARVAAKKCIALAPTPKLLHWFDVPYDEGDEAP